MKKSFLLSLFLLSFFSNSLNKTVAQNIGIGTNNPLSRLHIYTGASGNNTPYSPLVVEGSSNTYINLLTPNNAETGLLFGKQDNAGSGGIIYNNSTLLNGLQFRTNGNLTRMVLNSNGYLGIGTGSPANRLDVYGLNNWDLSSTEGDMRIGSASYRLKIGVATGGGGAGGVGIMQYGQTGGYNVLNLGAQGNTILSLNGNLGRAGIGTDAPNANLEVRSSNGFTVPQFLVRQTNANDYSRMRLTNASGNNYWDIATYHGASAADDRLSFFNGRNNSQLSMNGNSALLLNNTAGAPSQVAVSNGANASTSWATLGSLVKTFYQTGGGTWITTSNTKQDVPGSVFTISVPVKSRLIITGNFVGFGNSCLCGDSVGNLWLDVDGASSALLGYLTSGANSRGQTCLSNIFWDVNPGTHTIKFTTTTNYGFGNVEYMHCTYSTIMALPID